VKSKCFYPANLQSCIIRLSGLTMWATRKNNNLADFIKRNYFTKNIPNIMQITN